MVDPAFKIKTDQEEKKFGRFILEPLERGYGHTIGNALRRVLLSSLPGAAITNLRIEGVKHQFQTLPGLKEDIVEFILNLKKIRLRIAGTDKTEIRLEITGPGEITAGQIETPAEVEIINKDLVLGSLADKKSRLSAVMTVEKGYGYSLADDRKTGVVGLVSIDAAFSPVVRVNYVVESARVGRVTNLDKLILEIWTDGTISPSEAMRTASKVLVSYFLQIYEPKAQTEEVSVAVTPTVSEDVLKMLVEELDLPVRLENALKNGGIETVGQLLGTNRKDLLKIKNFGVKSFAVVEEKLREKGVALSI